MNPDRKNLETRRESDGLDANKAAENPVEILRSKTEKLLAEIQRARERFPALAKAVSESSGEPTDGDKEKIKSQLKRTREEIGEALKAVELLEGKLKTSNEENGKLLEAMELAAMVRKGNK